MKKVLFAALLIAGGYGAYAQNASHEDYAPKDMERKYVPVMRNEENTDTVTLGPASLGIQGCDVLYLYKYIGNGGGYVCGTNGIGDHEVAQRYDLWGTGHLYSILVLFGGKTQEGTSTITAKVYTSNGAPDVLLGTSN